MNLGRNAQQHHTPVAEVEAAAMFVSVRPLVWGIQCGCPAHDGNQRVRSERELCAGPVLNPLQNEVGNRVDQDVLPHNMRRMRRLILCRFPRPLWYRSQSPSLVESGSIIISPRGLLRRSPSYNLLIMIETRPALRQIENGPALHLVSLCHHQ
jgi:hypothetical protein